jgi:arylsulfatase A-like enzyme
MEGHRPYGVHDPDPAFAEPLSNDRIRSLMKKAGTDSEKITSEERELLVNLYDSDLRYCSDHLDRLFDELQRIGVWQDTNIVFTSDHGEEFYDHGQYFHRNLPYDELLHVPLLLRTPNGERCIETDSRELVDVAPTILNFHGVQPPDDFEGEPLLSGDSRKVLASGSQMVDGPVVACRWNGYKYIHAPKEKYLFDLEEDDGEERDISEELVDEVEQFKSAIPARYFSEEADETLRDPENEVDKEQLEALGYLEIGE